MNIIYNKNKTAIEVLNEVNENYCRLREKYESITQLVQVAAGKVPKKEKISLKIPDSGSGGSSDFGGGGGFGGGGMERRTT